MANAFGTLASSLIIQRALELVFTERPVLREITTDFSADPVKYGQSLITRTKSVATVNDFGTGATDVADTDVSVTLNNLKEIHHTFSLEELNSTDRNLVEESARPMAVGLANHMVDAIAALWTDTNFTETPVTVGSGWAYDDTIIALRKELAGRGVPSPWFFVANSDVYNSLLTDSTVVSALNNPSNGDAIRTGRLPQVSGMGITEYPDMPTTGNLVGFAGHKDSVVMNSRPPMDPHEVLGATPQGRIGYMTEPTTGLSVMVNEWVDMSTLAANVRLVWMYGVAVGNGNNGQLLTSA